MLYYPICNEKDFISLQHSSDLQMTLKNLVNNSQLFLLFAYFKELEL